MDLATIADDYDAMSCRISLIPFRLVVRHNILAPRNHPFAIATAPANSSRLGRLGERAPLLADPSNPRCS
jgi:hypothetical protein